MKKHLLFLLIVLFCQSLVAQSPPFAWAKSIGGVGDDKIWDVYTDSDGNLYVTGSFNGAVDFDPGPAVVILYSTLYRDAYFAKYNSAGDLLWAKSLGGNFHDGGRSIVTDDDGNVYIGGGFVNTVDFDPGVGVFNLDSEGSINTADAFLLKLDSQGNFVFAQRMGGNETDAIIDLVIDSQNNILMLGSFDSNASFGPINGVEQYITTVGGSDAFMGKMDSDGHLIWVKSFGGLAFDSVSGIAVDNNDNVFATGYYYLTVDFDPGAGVNNITETGNNLASEIFIEKLDTDGNFVWVRSIGAAGFDRGEAIEIDPFGNVLVTGTFESTVDFDASANNYNLTSPLTNQSFVLKLDNDGNFIWAGGFIGTSNGFGYGIDTDAIGNIYSTGFFNGTKDFDPGTAVHNLTANTGADIYISKLSPLGNFIWVKALGGSGLEEGTAINVDNSNNIYTTGDFETTGNFNSDSLGVAELNSNGGTDIWIQKMGSSAVEINELIEESEKNLVYPNPANSKLHLITPTSEELMLMEILNPLGQVCYTKRLHNASENIEVDTSELQQGIYYVKTYAKSGLQTITEFIKE
jgi:hypothetical protein